MNDLIERMDEDAGATEAAKIFGHEIGASDIEYRQHLIGNQTFLKFVVGRDAPYYKYALRETQKSLSINNPFRGALGLDIVSSDRFPASLEATSLLTLLTRSTRAVAQNGDAQGYSVPYVPFQNREDHQLAQPATHVVLGRRGVGKSTLIRRAIEIVRASSGIVAVLDMDTYSTLTGDDLYREVIYDICHALALDAETTAEKKSLSLNTANLKDIAASILNGAIAPATSIPRIKREVQTLTRATNSSALVFLDDYHLLKNEEQPKLLHLLHGALKGANAWLKVSGLRSLLNYYSPTTMEGLQTPGDAQTISLDLTLENPEAAETHLQAILDSFLRAVGYSFSSDVLPRAAFRRLVWANAGVPRDFLQMFGRSVEHAKRNKHTVVTLSDVNAAIGESGQNKMKDLAQDARNSESEIREMLAALEEFCLEKNSTNAFLVRSEESTERKLVHALSDLRLVHLINQSTTPDRAGERYEAFILDYSLFTGFRRRPNIVEMVPNEGQFKAAELRRLPKISQGFLESRLSE